MPVFLNFVLERAYSIMRDFVSARQSSIKSFQKSRRIDSVKPILTVTPIAGLVSRCPGNLDMGGNRV
jgi:hypothetical protein